MLRLFLFSTLAAFSVPALALDISVGDVSVSVGGGGVSASVGDTSVGVSTGDGGVSASASAGGNSAGASVTNDGVSASLNAGGNSAGLSAGAGGASFGAAAGSNSFNAAVSGGSGQFLTLDRDGGATSAAINLGGLFSGFLSGADEPEAGRVLAGIDPRTALLTPGPRNSPAELFRHSFNSMSRAKRHLARVSCASVLANPGAYAQNVRILCLLIARL